MKIQENLDKISWSIADKVVFIIFGFVSLIQMKSLGPSDYGLYTILINLHTWLFIISDSFALQNIVQFGMDKENRLKVNTISLITHICVSLGIALIIYILQIPFSNIFNEPKLESVASFLPILCLLFIPRTYCIKIIYREHKMLSLFFVNLAFMGTMSILTFYFLAFKSHLDFSDMKVIYISGAILSSLTAIITTFNELKFGFKGNIRLKTLISYSIPFTLTSSLHSAITRLDSLIILKFFSIEVVGIYSAAKTLFRFFEETINAAQGLVYPAAVRQFTKNDSKALNDLMTKSVSFLLFTMIIIVIILEFGISDLFISWFLPIKYAKATGLFNLLILSSLALPLVLLTSIILASGKPYVVFVSVIISICLSLITFYYININGDTALIPLGLMMYSFSLGIISLIYCNKNLGFKYNQLYRIINDSKYYFRKYIN